MVQIFWLRRQSSRIAQLDHRLYANLAALGLQRQRAPLLGLSLRRQDQKDRAAVTSLRIGAQCYSGPGTLSRAS